MYRRVFITTQVEVQHCPYYITYKYEDRTHCDRHANTGRTCVYIIYDIASGKCKHIWEWTSNDWAYKSNAYKYYHLTSDCVFI